MYDNVYSLDAETGTIALLSEKGVTYWRGCLEEKEIKKYAKENKQKLFGFNTFEFLAIYCSACRLQKEKSNKI